MGYNKSKKTVERMEPYLDRMFQSRQDIEWATDSPSSLAYRIREAIHAAGHHSEYDHYARLSDMYTVRALDETVQADYTPPIRTPTEVKRESPVTEPVEPESSGPTKLSVPEADSLHSVIGAAIKYKTYDELHFPSATLLPPEMQKLFRFAGSNEWKIIDHVDAGLTLTKRDVDEELTWSPNETSS